MKACVSGACIGVLMTPGDTAFTKEPSTDARASVSLPGTVTPTPNEFAKGTVTATLDTTAGSMKLEFFPDKAPKHVANFLDLSKRGVYDGTLFHRVVKGFVIQTGALAYRAADRYPDARTMQLDIQALRRGDRPPRRLRRARCR